MIEIRWRSVNSGDPQGFPRRVWRSDWSGDTFETADDQESFDRIVREISTLRVVDYTNED